MAAYRHSGCRANQGLDFRAIDEPLVRGLITPGRSQSSIHWGPAATVLLRRGPRGAWVAACRGIPGYNRLLPCRHVNDTCLLRQRISRYANHARGRQYICATASTPLAAALLLTGVSPGTVLVLLLAGPATNLGTLGVLRKELGAPVLLGYLLGVAVARVGLGLMTDMIVARLGIDVQAQLTEGARLIPHAAMDCGTYARASRHTPSTTLVNTVLNPGLGHLVGYAL